MGRKIIVQNGYHATSPSLNEHLQKKSVQMNGDIETQHYAFHVMVHSRAHISTSFRSRTPLWWWIYLLVRAFDQHLEMGSSFFLLFSFLLYCTSRIGVSEMPQSWRASLPQIPVQFQRNDEFRYVHLHFISNSKVFPIS